MMCSLSGPHVMLRSHIFDNNFSAQNVCRTANFPTSEKLCESNNFVVFSNCVIRKDSSLTFSRTAATYIQNARSGNATD